MLALSRNIFIRTFHWWSISCHSSVQSVPGGGPTIDLHNFRKWVPRRSRCRLYIVRCPPAKHATDDTTDSKYRKRFTMETFLSCSIHRFIWKTFDACWRWYCTSTSCNFEPRDVNMLPNHFCPASCGKTLRITSAVVANVWGGCASFVMTTVLSVFRSKPTRSKCLTSAPKRFPASTRDRPKTKMSSAKRKSSKLGPPSIKLKPTFPTSALHSRIAHCNTEQNKRGLSTHPCRTPPVILNLLFCPMSPTTSPHCPKYTHCKIHTRWTGIPSSTRAVHTAGQCTRSNAFDKSKLMIHTGIPTASALSKTKLAVTRCSSSRRPGRNPCCSSGCPASKNCSSRPSKRYANVLYNKRMFAIGLKSAGCNGFVFFRQHAEQRLAPWLGPFTSN